MYQRKKKTNYSENYLGENMILDRLIVMDDVSGLADRSEEFPNFSNFQENTNWHAYTFCILYIRQDNTGKWYCHRQKILIFFLDLFKLLQWLEFCHLLLVDTSAIMSHTKIFGLIDHILKYLILDRNSAWPLTHVT